MPGSRASRTFGDRACEPVRPIRPASAICAVSLALVIAAPACAQTGPDGTDGASPGGDGGAAGAAITDPASGTSFGVGATIVGGVGGAGDTLDMEDDASSQTGGMAGLDGASAFPGQIGVAAGDSFDVTVGGVTTTITISAGETLLDIAAEVDAIDGVTASATATGTNDKLTIASETLDDAVSLTNNNNTPLTAMGFGSLSLPAVSTPGGDGGDGGAGINATSGITTLENQADVAGGDGGDGGTTPYTLTAVDGGTGGDGGAGLAYSGGTSATITNSGTITGGEGGEGGAGSGGGDDGAGGKGGQGIRITSAAPVEIVNSGTISGGMGGDGTRALAIEIDGTGHALTLQTGSDLVGDVILGTADGLLRLEGDGTEDADFSGISTLETANGAGWSLAGDLDIAPGRVLNFDVGANGTLALSGAIHADDLSKSSAGTLEMTGDNSAFSGTTAVLAGNLVVGVAGSGSLGGVVEVKGGTLMGTGTLETVEVDAGVHAPGNSIGTQTVSGNYTLNGGTLEIEAQPGSGDRLIVLGDVTLNGGTLKIVETTGSGWSLAEDFTIIDNQGGNAITGDFSDFENDLVFLDASYVLDGGDGNDVILSLTRNDVDFTAVANTANQRATATGLQSLGLGNVLYDTFAGLGASSAATALDSLSGEIHASAHTALIANTLGLHAVLVDRANGRMAGLADAQAVPYAPAGALADASNTEAWLTPIGNWGRVDDNGNATALTYSGASVAFGVDSEIAGWRLGLAGEYDHATFSASGRDSSGSADGFGLGLYGGGRTGALDVSLGLGYGVDAVSTSRDVVAGGIAQTLDADYFTHSVHGFAEAALPVDLGGGLTLSPFAGASAIWERTDGYSETGGSAALTAAARSDSASFARLGFRADKDFALGTTLLTATAGAGYQIRLHGGPTASHRFAGGTDFTVAGAAPDQNALNLTAGLKFDMPGSAGLAFSYEGQFTSGSQRHRAEAALSVQF